MKYFTTGSFLMLMAVSGINKACIAQSIGTFNSIQPTSQSQQLVLPSTHTFQRIITTGDALSLGGTLGSNLDFTGYVPVTSSTHGYLSISSETVSAECSILDISYNGSSKLWAINSGGKVSFPMADLGFVSAFCSGTVTPRNTVMICEEVAPAGDGNSDGYEDLGWVIEIDPATRTVINQDNAGGVDKLWAVGRQAHENVALNAAETVMYWGADASTTGFIYKFVPTVAAKYTSGSLYVLKTTASLGTGTWELISNGTQSERNNTITASQTAGAFNFNGIEDVEIGPDGKIYFSAKAAGRIYRFRDLGAGVDQLEVFVESTNYDVDGAGPFAAEPWGIGNDNLAFDNDGNLWVLQDGSRNHIWVVGPSHTAASPDVRLFATTPQGCEPTGITFTPDNRYIFLSFQHPSSSNSAAQNDAAGNSVVFNAATTVVIARKEFLGMSVVPVVFENISLKQKETGIEISWKTHTPQNHDAFYIERSVDQNNFETLHVNRDRLSDSSPTTLSYLDNNPPPADLLYYRIRQCDKDGSCRYSPVRSIHRITGNEVRVYPVPASATLNIDYPALSSSFINFNIINTLGAIVVKKRVQVNAGINLISIPVGTLSKGAYLINIADGKQPPRTIRFSKN